jgi:Heterokaryon incompatibility protein (HET)
MGDGLMNDDDKTLREPLHEELKGHSCLYCQDVRLFLPCEAHLQHNPNQGAGTSEVQFGEFQANKVESARSTCSFFEWCASNFPDSHTLVDPWVLRAYTIWDLTNRKLRMILLRWMNPEQPQELYQFEMDFVSSAGERHGLLMANYALKVLIDVIEETLWQIKRLPFRLDVSSDTFFGRLRRQLHHCQQNHHECNEAGGMTMPSYLIKISDVNATAPYLRLISPHMRVEYVALSYCWGSGRQLKTLTQTVCQFVDHGIPYSQLPKTIQDAVIATQKLGLHFLWVDAICIVQDDAIFMTQELALMPEIYCNATLTICASRTSSCDDGFLQDVIRPDLSRDLIWEIGISQHCQGRFYIGSDHVEACPGSAGHDGRVFCFFSPGRTDRTSLLDGRAWTFQEYLLPIRILDFDSYSWTWVCLPPDMGYEGVPGQTKDVTIEKLLAREGFHIETKVHQSLGESLWGFLASHYNRRAVTYQDDKLPAISALAKVVGTINGDVYLAGIWKSHFPAGLLWKPFTGRTATVLWKQFSDPRRTNQYVAPSWSWASTLECLFTTVSQYDLVLDRNFRLISYQILPEMVTFPYGKLNGASITIYGLIRKLLWDSSSQTIRLIDDKGEDTLATPWQDVPRDAQANPVVWCLLIGHHMVPDCDRDDVVCEGRGCLAKDHCDDDMDEFSDVHHGMDDQGPRGLILVSDDSNDLTFRRCGVFDYERGSLQDRKSPEFWDRYRLEKQIEWVNKSVYRTITIL